MLANAKIYGVLPAKDLKRAQRFYQEKLEIGLGNKVTAGVVYECGGGTKFLLYETPNAGMATNTSLCWLVDDLDQEVENLKAHDIELEKYDMEGVDPATGISTTDESRVAWFTDSEGNILCLTEMK